MSFPSLKKVKAKRKRKFARLGRSRIKEKRKLHFLRVMIFNLLLIGKWITGKSIDGKLMWFYIEQGSRLINFISEFVLMRRGSVRIIANPLYKYFPSSMFKISIMSCDDNSWQEAAFYITKTCDSLNHAWNSISFVKGRQVLKRLETFAHNSTKNEGYNRDLRW